MSIIEELKKAKDGNEEAMNKIISHYRSYIFYNINKYNIYHIDDCCDEVEQKIRKAVFIFKIEKK